MNTLTRTIRWLTLLGLGVSGVLLHAVILIIMANVVLRLLGMPIIGLYEIMAALTVMVLGLSLADSQREKQHVAIDILTEKFDKRVQDGLAVLTTVLSTMVFAVITLALLRYASFQFAAGTTSDLLGLPSWPSLSALIAGFVLLLLVLLGDLWRQGTSSLTNSRKEETW